MAYRWHACDMDGRDRMRAADADREVVADRLRAALGEGRLDLHEYDERLQRAYGATTYAELEALLADLPGPVPSERAELVRPGDAEVAESGAAGHQRPATVRWLVEIWEPWLKVVPIVLAVWAATSVLSGQVLYLWPAWVAGPWGAVLVVRTVTGLATGEPRRWTAERDRKQQAKTAKRDRRRQAEAEKRAAERDSVD